MGVGRGIYGSGEKRNACRILVEKLKESSHLEDLDINKKKILK
jgi:hypothetical protein